MEKKLGSATDHRKGGDERGRTSEKKPVKKKGLVWGERVWRDKGGNDPFVRERKKIGGNK